jgi:phenylacetate-CoA ligase
MNKSKIYQKAPYPLQVLICSYVGLRNRINRFSGSFKDYYENLKKLWYAELPQVYQYQRSNLEELLIEAVTYSPWYREKAAENNITIEDIKTDPYAALYKFPTLSKEERREFPDKLSNTKPGRETHNKGYTSGTSGSPTISLWDKESTYLSFAQRERYYTIIGLPERKLKNVRFSGRILVSPFRRKPPFWVYNFIEKQLLMSTYHMTDENLAHYVKKLNRFKPEFFEGYPSAIYILAKYIKKEKLSINFNLLAISTTAETLFEYQREIIEEVFKCKVFNFYASSEGGPLITECKKGNLHLNLDTGIFEFHKPKGAIEDGRNIAELVVTSLRQYKIPLIRYAIKDIVELQDEGTSCDCGCKMPMVKRVIGREDDLLWTRERGFVGRMDTAYKGLEHIVKSQIVQKTPDLLEVYSIVDNNYNKKMEEAFHKNLHERLGNNIAIRFYYVDDIPLGKAGKFVAVKREFPLQG